MLSRFHLIPERDRRTDRQTDGRTDLLYQYRCRAIKISFVQSAVRATTSRHSLEINKVCFLGRH